MNRRVWPVIAIVGAIAVAAIYAWPGLMTYDSQEQLRQARAGQFTDWHPPIMSALWGLFDRIVAGPLLMFLLQIVAFAAGAYVLLARRASARAAALWTIAIVAVPSTLSLMTVVVKDSLMCGALLVGVAAITSADRRVRLGGLAAFAFAAALRYNAFAAVVPLVAWLWPANLPAWRRRVLGAGIGIAVSAAGVLANQMLSPERAHLFELGLLPEDIVGTIAYAPDLPDADVRVLVDGLPVVPARDLQSQARVLHDPNAFPLDLIRGVNRFFDEPTTDADFAAVRAAWKRTIAAHPLAYLAERFDRFRWLLGLTDGPWEPVYSVQNERATLRSTHNDEIPHGAVQRWLGRRMTALGRHSIVFRPYLYLLVTFALLVVRRRDPLQVALALATLGYLAGLYFAAPAPDIRYAQLLVVTALVGFALHVAESTSKRSTA